ncbi:TlpA disulfide reductase family protein [Hymenobacter fodinae]|uniref:AhpC/TSA family protein n=1 Tax=Hymenobacter fodinae TaxID=2510796 RepID=A0A4Z0P009_9BACT|nr:TlpA disulfide reductase family protein [Hymenobacter fodinae]TGE03788.1 AhpC/TSA family protein [Hymenobacter fodinae]
MKSLLSILLILLPFLSPAQTAGNQPEAYTVKGQLNPKAGVSRVYLFYILHKVRVLDSARVEHGRFQFRGALPEPVPALLSFTYRGAPYRPTENAAPFFLEEGSITITTPDSARQAVATGTPLNSESNALAVSLKPLQDQQDAIRQEFAAQPAERRQDSAYAAATEARLAALELQQRQAYAAYIQAHPSSRFSLFALQHYGGPTPEVESFARLYQTLAPTLRRSPIGQRLGQQIAALQRVAIGALAPDFVQHTPEGKPVRLSELRGKYVLIDFWASWCGPCREENPNLVKTYAQYKDKGFTVLGVSLDRPGAREAWVKAIAADGLPWLQVSDLTRPNAAAEAYGVQTIPQNFLLDPAGRIVATNLRGETLKQKLAELLGKS